MSEDWHAIARDLGERGYVARKVDLHRFLDCCPMSLREFGAALNQEVRRVDSHPILMGYSMGGRLALHALLEDPLLWKGAVIVSAHTGLKQEQTAERAKRVVQDTEWAGRALLDEWEDFLLAWNRQGVLQGGGELQWPSRLGLKSRRRQIARSFMDWSLGQQDDLSQAIKDLETPLMWVNGQGDSKFLEVASRLKELRPQLHHQVISSASHRVPWENQKEFVNQVSLWLQERVI